MRDPGRAGPPVLGLSLRDVDDSSSCEGEVREGSRRRADSASELDDGSHVLDNGIWRILRFRAGEEGGEGGRLGRSVAACEEVDVWYEQLVWMPPGAGWRPVAVVSSLPSIPKATLLKHCQDLTFRALPDAPMIVATWLHTERYDCSRCWKVCCICGAREGEGLGGDARKTSTAAGYVTSVTRKEVV